MIKRARTFLQDSHGSITALFMVLFPLLLLIGGIATDVSLMNAQKRYAQSQADLAAQAAIRHLPDAAKVRDTARKVVAANTRYGTITLADSDIEFGKYSSATGAFVPQASATGATAIRVNVASPFDPILLEPIIPADKRTLHRRAVAAQDAVIVFRLRNSLLNVNTERSILDPLLSNLLGLRLNTTVAGYGGLANVRLDLDDLLGLGARFADLGVGLDLLTFNDVLNAPIELTRLLGLDPLKGVLTLLSGGRGPRTIKLGDLLRLSPGLAKLKIGDVLPDVSINAFDLVTALLGLSGATLPDQQRVRAGVGINLSPLADVSLKVGLISQPVTAIARMNDSPLPTATIEQANVALSAEVLDLSAIKGPSLLNLSLNLGAIRASAVPTALNCSATGNQTLATFTVTPSLAALRLHAGVLESRVNGKLSALIEAVIKVSITSDSGSKDILGSPTTINLTHQEFLNRTGKTVPLTGLVASLSRSVSDLILGLKLEVTLLGILPIGAILDAIVGDLMRLVLRPILDLLAVILDPLIDGLLRILGIQVLPAELFVDDFTCAGRLVQ